LNDEEYSGSPAATRSPKKRGLIGAKSDVNRDAVITALGMRNPLDNKKKNSGKDVSAHSSSNVSSSARKNNGR
jgi:hypothetical protein